MRWPDQRQQELAAADMQSLHAACVPLIVQPGQPHAEEYFAGIAAGLTAGWKGVRWSGLCPMMMGPMGPLCLLCVLSRVWMCCSTLAARGRRSALG